MVLITPSLTFVLFGALMEGRTVWAKAAEWPDYFRRTVLHFDFGQVGPVTQPEKISHLVLHGAVVDGTLLAGGLVLGTIAGLVTGTIAGARRRTKTDRVLALGSAAALSVPVYWLGFMVLVLFAPGQGRWGIPFVTRSDTYRAITDDPLAWLQSLWVPWVVLAIPLAAMCHRLTRAVLADILEDDLLRTARAKGVGERRVMFRHALPAALPPVIGLISVNVALLVTNVIVIETPFNLPGAFRHANVGLSVIYGGDKGPGINFEIVQGLVVEAAVLIAITTLICDLVHAALDPRVAARALG